MRWRSTDRLAPLAAVEGRKQPADMTTTPVLTLRTPGEIAAVVPYLTGFVPRESLVAISLRGPSRRVGLTLRTHLDEHPEVVAQVVEAMVRDRARLCIVTVHTSTPTGKAHPWAALVDAVEIGLRGQGIDLGEALLVRDGLWWSYRCAGRCCPPSGTPIDTTSPVVQATASAHALAGRAVLGSREELVASLQPQLPLGAALARRLQGQAVEALRDQVLAGAGAAEREELRRWRAALDAWEQQPGTLPPAQAAALGIGLHLPPVRDTVASWAVDRHDALLGLLLQLCRVVVGPDDAPLCAVVAWVAYAQGNGALALVAVQRALATDPTYSLAELLLAVIDGVVAPDQVRALLRDAA